MDTNATISHALLKKLQLMSKNDQVKKLRDFSKSNMEHTSEM